MSTAIDFLSWDGNSADAINPRRPSTDDLGGDNKLDDADFPPGPEHPDAKGHNHVVRQVAALARVAESCKLEVRFNAGVPYVARATAPGANITAATFAVTDNGTGDTTVTWPANTFPPHQCSPTGLTPLWNAGVEFALEEVPNGIRVRTFVGGVATNVPWTVGIN